MSYVNKWLNENTEALSGRTVAISGSTGGIGRELCVYLLKLGASLILLDRNRLKSETLKSTLQKSFPSAEISLTELDLENTETVSRACDELEKQQIYALILNAGAYSIPRHKCSTGYDNLFQINFLSPYYMARRLAPNVERIVAVGSIAHNYSKTDSGDIDFSGRKKNSLVYGNAKRYLMYSLQGLFENEVGKLAITHPGITFTGITDHYPKLIFAVIKHPMKVIFMKPKYACLSILRGVFESTESGTWIGPCLFNVWGYPKKTALKTANEEERMRICKTAERIYHDMEKGLSE